MLNTEFYKTASGRCHVENFLDSLTDQDAKEVTWVIRLIERTWPDRVSTEYLKKLRNGIWEVRVRGRDSIFRVLSFFLCGDKLILTHGYSKKEKKTDPNEIDKAIKYRRDYIERNKVK